MPRNINIAAAVLLSAPFILTACGSDGGGAITGPVYSGDTAAAVITADNAEEIALTSTEASTQAISEDIANESNPFGFKSAVPGISSVDVSKTIAYIINKEMQTGSQLAARTLGAETFGSDPYYCGGSITVPDNENATAGTMTFSNLCFNLYGEITMNGSISFSQTATAISISMINFTVTFEGESYTINSSSTCTLDSDGFPVDCTISSTYTGEDGLIYRVDDFTVSGSSTTGFDVDATFYHPAHGSVSVTTSASLMFECTGPQPSSGQISFTGAGSTSGSITFDSCSSYTYCYDTGSGPTCDTGTW